MSHRGGGGAQSKASKTEKKGEGKGRETTPLVTTEIVPGRLNESEWSLLLDRDEGQDFAAEVVFEIVDTVLGISYDSYLDIAVIPYTVDHFQALLEEVIEAQFPICDIGEPILPSADVDVIISHPDFIMSQPSAAEMVDVAEEEEEEEEEDAAAAVVVAAKRDDERIDVSVVVDTTAPPAYVVEEEAGGGDDDAEEKEELVAAGRISRHSGEDAEDAEDADASLSLEAADNDEKKPLSAVAEDVGDVSWMEDEEPVCGITDSWAQGSVPVQKTGQGTSRPLSRISAVMEEEEGGVEEGQLEAGETERTVGTPIGQGPSSEENVIDGDPTSSSKDQTSPMDRPTKCPWEGKAKLKSSSKKKTQVKEKTSSSTTMQLAASDAAAEGTQAPLGGAFLSSTSILSLDAPLLPRYSGAVVRTQNGRPPGKKDIAYDQLGNVVGVARINPDKLPNHQIQTKVKINSSQREGESSTKSPLRHRNRGSPLKPPGRLPSIPSSKLGSSEGMLMTSMTSTMTPPSIPLMPTIDDIVFPLATSNKVGGVTPTDSFDESMGKTMIDRIEVSPGVIIRENDRIKVGPEIPSPDTSAFTRLSDTRGSLQPIKARLPTTLAIKDMVERRTPTLRPYHEKPLITQYGRAK